MIRSNLNWSLFGDRDTKFFHSYVKQKHRKNNVSALRDDDNNWVMDRHHRSEIANMFMCHLQKILHTNSTHLHVDLADLSAYVPTTNNLLFLANIPTMDEVKQAVFEMGPLQTPGPDGFHPLSYQKIGAYLVYILLLLFKIS